MAENSNPEPQKVSKQGRYRLPLKACYRCFRGRCTPEDEKSCRVVKINEHKHDPRPLRFPKKKWRTGRTGNGTDYQGNLERNGGECILPPLGGS